MSFFADFVGGAARTLLDERKVALAEKLRKEEEQRRQDQRIVATSYDPDRRKIFESLASGETREIDMPEAMQQDLIRKRVMDQREQLLKDADRERSLAALAKKEAEEAERLKLDRMRTEADIDYKGAAAAESRARAEAVGKPRQPSPLRPSDVRALNNDLNDALNSFKSETNPRKGVPPEIRAVYETAKRALDAGNLPAYSAALAQLNILGAYSEEERGGWIEEVRKQRAIDTLGSNLGQIKNVFTGQ